MNSRLLAIIVVLQGLILAGQWSNSGGTHAYADVPDQLNARGQAVDELRSLNTKMDHLIQILNSGNLQVKVVEPDDKNKEPARGSVR